MAGRFRVGDRVTALPLYRLRDLRAPALNGQRHRCPAVISGGFGKLPGAYADFVRVGVHEALACLPMWTSALARWWSRWRWVFTRWSARAPTGARGLDHRRAGPSGSR